MQFNTETLSEHDITLLADIMADNPEFAKRLVDAISEKLDDKFGHQQGWMSGTLEELSEKLDQMSSDMKHGFDNVDKRFDTIDQNMEMSGQRQDLFDRRIEKIEDRLK